ncbi:MAG: FAD-dependent oxidoreductase [Pyrinomonadaceae bacterium]|nr:FAD-dependent oxidoreductase [Pyrinomonadaceae bacterium]
MSEIYDLIVIGGGSAGLVAAGGAGILGARVALVEKSKLGGDCLYTGCVPSKTLIRSARFAADMKSAEKYGFQISDLKFKNGSFASITNRIQEVIGVIEEHDAPEVFEEMGAEIVFGSPKFVSKNEIEVDLKDGGKRRMKAKRFCISTGSSPFVPPIEGLEETGFITNEEVFELGELPANLLVLGGGAIGCELGQSFQRFGASVTLVEMADRILINEDAAVSEFMKGVFESEGMKVLTGTKAVKFHKNPNGKKVVTVESDGKTFEIVCDEILAAVGRKPNTSGLDLETAGVKTDQGKIVVDEYLRTTNKAIYAAGDVNGKFQFTHMADYEAQIVLQNCFLFYPLTKKAEYSVVPWTTFTEPEIARVGITEKQAIEKFGSGVKVYQVPFSHNDRAQAEGDPEGFAKLVLKGKRILGVTIVGIHAGELLSEFTVAMKHGLSLEDLNKAIHVYPTLAKITQALGTERTIEGLKKPWVQKWFARYLKLWR